MKPLHTFLWYRFIRPILHRNHQFFIMTKEQTEKKKSLARTLYMSGMDQAEIAEKVEVSRVTISNGVRPGAGRRQGRLRVSHDQNSSTNFSSPLTRLSRKSTRRETRTSLLGLATNWRNYLPSSRNSIRRRMSSTPSRSSWLSQSGSNTALRPTPL